MLKKAFILGLAVATLGLTGCATITSGTTQELHVQAIDAKSNALVSGAHCVISDADNNNFKLLGNPATIEMKRARAPLTILCKKSGYIQAQAGVGSTFNAWTVGDVFFWPGLIVDGIDGAMTSYDKTHITVVMAKDNYKAPKKAVGTKVEKKS